MDLQLIQQLIGSLGFPVVVAGWLLYRDYKLDRHFDAKLDQIVSLLQSLVETIKERNYAP